MAAYRNPLSALGFARVAAIAAEARDRLPFALLGRGYDLPLALRLQSHHVCTVSQKPVRQNGQRYRNRAVLIDAATHRVLYQWTS